MNLLMELVYKFKALADKTRLRIISLLFEKNLCVCEITDILKMTQSRISRHLGILKQAGFIEEERKGKWVIYKISNRRNHLLSHIQRQLKNEPKYAADMARMKKTLEKKLCPINN